MATGMSLSIGYISGATTNMDEAGAYQLLKQLFTPLKRAILDAIIRAMPEVEQMHDEFGQYFGAYIARYNASNGNPVSFDDDNLKIHISCSGSGISRKMKEMAAMAVCREIIYQMNVVYGVPICLSVY